MLGIGPHSVFVDANVIFSRTVRDWLGLLYTESHGSLFQVFWTEDVLAEAMYHLRKKHPGLSGQQVARVRDLIAGTFEVGRVTDFAIDPGWVGTDPHDAHVHAAATACGADILLTANQRDFDDDSATYSVYSPDEFFVLVEESAPDIVKAAVRSNLRYWMTKQCEPHLPLSLKTAGCPVFAERVRRHLLALSEGQALFGC